MDKPIYVNWIPQERAPNGWQGQLGITFAPGKKDPGGGGVTGAVHNRDLLKDFSELKRLGTTLIVPLIEEHEYTLLDIGDYLAHAEAQGIEVMACPIPDISIPHDLQAFGALMRAMTEALQQGERVVVHCRGGLGRAGLTAASLLVRSGMERAQAVALVREVRPGAIETDEQEAFVYTQVGQL